LNCKKCGGDLPPGALFCPYCGKAVSPQPKQKKKRGNGTGSVYKTENGNYMAIVTLGYYIDDGGKRHRRTRSKVFTKKSDAVNALAKLKTDERKEQKKQITFKQLYDLWLPTHKAGLSTIGCYTAAIKHFQIFIICVYQKLILMICKTASMTARPENVRRRICVLQLA
jgi:hypothetical protein